MEKPWNSMISENAGSQPAFSILLCDECSKLLDGIYYFFEDQKLCSDCYTNQIFRKKLVLEGYYKNINGRN